MVYFYFLDILTSFSFIAESTESDIEELRYDCYISRIMGYTIFFSYLFFFSARMTQMMTCIENKKKQKIIHVPHCWNSYIVICLLELDSIIFVFVFHAFLKGVHQ